MKWMLTAMMPLAFAGVYLASNWGAIQSLLRSLAVWPSQLLCSTPLDQARQHSESGKQDRLWAAKSVQLCTGGSMALLPMHCHVTAWGKLTAHADGLSHWGRRDEWNRSNHPSSVVGWI